MSSKITLELVDNYHAQKEYLDVADNKIESLMSVVSAGGVKDVSKHWLKQSLLEERQFAGLADKLVAHANKPTDLAKPKTESKGMEPC